MRRKVGIGLGIVVLAGLVTGASFLPKMLAVEAAEKATKVSLKIKLPSEDAKVTVDGKDYDNSSEINLETTKEKITVVAKWKPNGYTDIKRTRIVDTKPTIELDMRNADPKMKDDITVIYVPTPEDVVEEMCKLAKVTKDDVVYDLGCGDGRMVITAVKKFGARKGVGVDLFDDRVKESKENVKKAADEMEKELRKIDKDLPLTLHPDFEQFVKSAIPAFEKKLEIRKGDVLKIDDLPDATVVLLYMGEDINLRLRPILKSKLKPGSRVVSHRFTMGDWEPTRTVVYRGNPPNNYDYTLLLWVIGGEKKDKQ